MKIKMPFSAPVHTEIIPNWTRPAEAKARVLLEKDIREIEREADAIGEILFCETGGGSLLMRDRERHQNYLSRYYALRKAASAARGLAQGEGEER